jgi:FtsZ-binding cell division protein ZapB
MTTALEEIATPLTGKCSPKRMEPAERLPSNRVPSYFWGQDSTERQPSPFRKDYAEARQLIGDGSADRLEELVQSALNTLGLIFQEIEEREDRKESSDRTVELRLSDELQQWREEQYRLGRLLPRKGDGLTRTSDEVIRLLRAEDWPDPLLINGALFGSGFANMLIGAYDAETLYSNYCVDMGFFYEHSYHKVFPEFELMVKKAVEDPHALQTFGGRERRLAVEIGLRYIKHKVALEERHKTKLAFKGARLNRREAQILLFCESSILGIAGEAMARGFDRGGVMNDFIFSKPGTDVIDVGSDLWNSEVLNAFLSTADIADSGVITEEGLRRVYDAYAHCGARMFTERWSEPGARMCTTLYTWHIQNNRHEFFRRALLGYPKARKNLPFQQREADFCEAFDVDFRTTGFSRPLAHPCSGGDVCDQVQHRLRLWDGDDGLLAKMWWLLSTGPVQYVIDGAASEDRENELAERLRVVMATAYSNGLIDEMTWLTAHANHHAWQVNYLFQAAMFGSLLDSGELKGKLDRRAY